MLCKECSKRESCIKLCPEAEFYVNMDYIKRSRNERLECDLKVPLDNMIDIGYEGEIELNTEDWKYFVKNYKMTKKQKKYLFLKFWKCLSFTNIGKKYKVSPQTVDQTIRRFINEQNTNS